MDKEFWGAVFGVVCLIALVLFIAWAITQDPTQLPHHGGTK